METLVNTQNRFLVYGTLRQQCPREFLRLIFLQLVALLWTAMNCTRFLFRRGFCKVLPAAWPSPLFLQSQEGTWYAALFPSGCWEGLRPFAVCCGC